MHAPRRICNHGPREGARGDGVTRDRPRPATRSSVDALPRSPLHLPGDGPDTPGFDEEALDLDRALPRLEQLFADDDVTQAAPADLLATHDEAAGPLAVLARGVARRSRARYAKSNAWWLYAQALEFLDVDGVETERALRQALEASADHVSAASDLAWHLDDRTNAIAALADADITDDPLPEDVTVISMVLFEGGLVDDFVRLRGPLLPADELELLHAWAEVRASAYEVVEVDPGVGLQMLDLTTGERHEVVERTASQQLLPDQVMLTWLVPYPDGTTRIALGAAPLPVHKRPSVLALLDREPTALDLASWYASLFAPPRLHNTDGDPMTMCRTVVEVDDVEAARTALDAVGTEAAELTNRRGARLHAEQEAVHLTVEADSGTTIIGIVRLGDGELELEANSVSRIEALQALVLERVPGAMLVEDERVPVEDMLGDEQTPALDDLTPREAAADPTRRDDLEALLDEFPPADAMPGPGRGIASSRLRRLLGLDT